MCSPSQPAYDGSFEMRARVKTDRERGHWQSLVWSGRWMHNTDPSPKLSQPQTCPTNQPSKRRKMSNLMPRSRPFFQSGNFPANLFWHQIGPDTDIWHWNVGCNFHLETVGLSFLPGRARYPGYPDNLKDRFLSSSSPMHPHSLSFWGIKVT